MKINVTSNKYYIQSIDKTTNNRKLCYDKENNNNSEFSYQAIHEKEKEKLKVLSGKENNIDEMKNDIIVSYSLKEKIETTHLYKDYQESSMKDSLIVYTNNGIYKNC